MEKENCSEGKSFLSPGASGFYLEGCAVLKANWAGRAVPEEPTQFHVCLANACCRARPVVNSTS